MGDSARFLLGDFHILQYNARHDLLISRKSLQALLAPCSILVVKKTTMTHGRSFQWDNHFVKGQDMKISCGVPSIFVASLEVNFREFRKQKMKGGELTATSTVETDKPTIRSQNIYSLHPTTSHILLLSAFQALTYSKWSWSFPSSSWRRRSTPHGILEI